MPRKKRAAKMVEKRLYFEKKKKFDLQKPKNYKLKDQNQK